MTRFSAIALSCAALLAAAGQASAAAVSQTPQQQYLSSHNSVRAQHGAKDLTWSTTLAATAQNWSNKCMFQHSGSRYGENIAAGTGSFSIANAVQLWVNEASSYNASNPKPFHFTQVVWKSTTQLGCASTACNNILPGFNGVSQFYVCEYHPPGNVIGRFSQNVQV